MRVISEQTSVPLLRSLALLTITALFGWTISSGSQVRQVNLEELTFHADRIFSGRCVETTVLEDPRLGLPVTVATFEVDHAVKGDLGATVQIRLIGDRTNSLHRGNTVPGMPAFQKGEEVVLFLYGDSELGLTSPVGLGQGKFNIYVDKHGAKIALNALRNKNLLQGLSDGAQTRLVESAAGLPVREGVALQTLLGMAESLVPMATDGGVAP